MTRDLVRLLIVPALLLISGTQRRQAQKEKDCPGYLLVLVTEVLAALTHDVGIRSWIISYFSLLR